MIGVYRTSLRNSVFGSLSSARREVLRPRLKRASARGPEARAPGYTSSGRIPQPHRLITAASGQQTPVRAERHRRHVGGVAGERGADLSIGGRRFRRACEVMDDHREAVDNAIELGGIVVDIAGVLFAFDPTGVSLLIELLDLVWKLSGNPKVHAGDHRDRTLGASTARPPGGTGPPRPRHQRRDGTPTDAARAPRLHRSADLGSTGSAPRSPACAPPLTHPSPPVASETGGLFTPTLGNGGPVRPRESAKALPELRSSHACPDG